MSEEVMQEQEERLNQFYAKRGTDRAGVLQAGWTYVTDSHDIEALKKLAETIKKTIGSETNLLVGMMKNNRLLRCLANQPFRNNLLLLDPYHLQPLNSRKVSNPITNRQVRPLLNTTPPRKWFDRHRSDQTPNQRLEVLPVQHRRHHA